MAVLFITTTMTLLVVASFWLKVPKASIPLVFIYIVFMLSNANEDDIRQTALDNGMTTLREAGLARVLDGTTSIEEIMRSTVEDL